MAAGGFKEFVAGEVLDQDEINDYLMQGMLVFAGTAARGSAITSPVEGQFSFLKDSDTVEFYDGSGWVEYSGAPPLFDFLVVGGGGGGGREGGGGGAGGYRNSVTGELTGGSAVAERQLFVSAGTVTVTVGAGGAGSTSLTLRGFNGADSVFSSIVSAGGGGGASVSVPSAGGGGSGGGSYAQATTFNANAVFGQGTVGGRSATDFATFSVGGGGGGAGQAGQDANGSTKDGGDGGDGLASSITGSSVTRGGGGGGTHASPGTPGSGGAGGGGASGNPAVAGTVNTGGGGGGGIFTHINGANGGSGLVVIKYPSSITLTIGAGLTSSTSTSGLFKITTFTAGTDTVSF